MLTADTLNMLYKYSNMSFEQLLDEAKEQCVSRTPNYKTKEVLFQFRDYSFLHCKKLTKQVTVKSGHSPEVLGANLPLGM